jgi:hypothetical protein
MGGQFRAVLGVSVGWSGPFGTLSWNSAADDLRIEEQLMIDDQRKTNLLMAMLEEALPIRTNVTSYLAGALAKQSSETPIPTQCNVIGVHYTGDMGGILCRLDIGGADSKTPFLVSITHLAFNRNAPLAREIEAYQRHRNKKLKQQQGRGY